MNKRQVGSSNESTMEHVPFKHKRTTLERAEKFISEHYWTDINLRNRVYTDKEPLKKLTHCAVPDRKPYAHVLDGSFVFEACQVGDSFGPVWSTHWFSLTICVPPKWKGMEVHLLWDSGCEAMVFVNTEPVQGLSGDNGRISFPLTKFSKETEFTVHIEMACNTLFGIGNGVTQRKADNDRKFTVTQAEIAVFDRIIYDLILDVETLHDIAKELPETNQRGYQALYTVNRMINVIDFVNRDTLSQARSIAKEFFCQKNGDSQHTLYAMGHSHIDTAWLWPYDETKRKCARSWSCTLRLMEQFPDFKFMCSQAQQYEWVKAMYPSVWADICKFVKSGQFVPVGGTWIEMDGNIPSGESCIRQFLYGQRFFMKEFGIQCKEFWLPDTFGYSAQFPQIMQHCGVTRFLTQKLSWSLVNKFPHHTFNWEGIDGSRVLAHFPPGDSYEMKGRVSELIKSVENFQDKGRSNRSMYLFGYGDGGNGPSEEMLERLERLKNCDGLPKVKHSTSDEFFSSIEQEMQGDKGNMLCRWRGELYLELHNGTYTTWGLVKKYNRCCEVWLRDLELLATMATGRNGYIYPRDELDRMWKLLMLNQFHDVLPGTSITMVFKDAIEYYKDIEKTVNALISAAAKALVCEMKEQEGDSPMETFIVNTQPFPREEVLDLRKLYGENKLNRTVMSEVSEHNISADLAFVAVKVPPTSVVPLRACVASLRAGEEVQPAHGFISLKQEDSTPFGNVFVLDNGIIRALVDMVGRVVSLKTFDKTNNVWSKEAVNPQFPMNQFVMFDDVPLYWDAWDVMDYHLETRKPVTDMRTISVESNSLRATVKVALKLANDNVNTIYQEVILDLGSPYLRINVEATWSMNRKCLKVEFPTTVHATEAAYDIQSGFLRRPNHYNTSWDAARFEVCGHKYADISEHGFGVSVINDCKYGWAAVDGTLRLSLLRSPKMPDPEADMGTHHFSYAILPHFGTFPACETIKTSLAFNNPLRTVLAPCSTSHSEVTQQMVLLDSDQVVLQAVKMAEDDSSTVVVRLHESYGGCTTTILNTCLPVVDVQACNGLEQVLEGEDNQDLTLTKEDGRCSVRVELKPFQIVSLRLCLV